jgi:hypothetical protein
MLSRTGRGRGIQQRQLSTGGERFPFLPALLARVELVEAVADDGDGEGDDEDPEDGAEAAQHLPESGDGTDVTVPHLHNTGEYLYRVSTDCCVGSAKVVTGKHVY